MEVYAAQIDCMDQGIGRIVGELTKHSRLDNTLLLFLQGLLSPSLPGTMGLLTALGLSCGLFVVPVNALVQWRSPKDRRGSVIALQNTAVFSGVLLGSLGAGFFAQLGLHAAAIFLIAGAGLRP